jgi:hypothetical protein
MCCRARYRYAEESDADHDLGDDLAASSALFVREGYMAPTQEWAHLAQPRATRL